MIRLRLGAALALAAMLALATRAPEAQASATVHKLSLVLSAMPTQVDGGDFNTSIERFNQLRLLSHGFEGLDKIGLAWEYDASLHYFVRSNLAMNLGVGQLRTQTKREFLPGLLQDVNIRAEVLSVPVHLGVDYYLAPYNQGDFQARAFVGGGFLGLVGNHALIEQVNTNADSILNATFGPSNKTVIVRDSPGYYLEGGVHMFFASHFSVMLSGLYRSAVIREMLDQETGLPVARYPDGRPFTLNLSGIGAKLGVGFGF